MRRVSYISIVVFYLVFIASALLAQTKTPPPIARDTSSQQPIELISAGELEKMVQKGVEARYLRSTDSLPVRFRQGDMQFTCKEAIQFPDSNFVAAFGDVFVERGDSIQLKGDTLLYYGNERFAELRQNVYFTDQIIEMESPYANYDLAKSIASYQYGAVITDTAATLSSVRGYYYTQEKLLAFRGDVVLDNPSTQYHIETDTLTYNTQYKIAYFQAPTLIDSRDGQILANKGEYQTELGKSYFQSRVTLENEEYIVSADTLNYDEQTKSGTARGKVAMFDKTDSLTIYGNFSNFNGSTNYLEVFGNALVEKPFGADTLFLAADTLQSMQDSTEASQLLAYSRVKLFSQDLEGVCDSLSYQTTDSLIEFFKNPVIWTDKSQLTADTLIATLLNNNIDQLRMRKNAFLISEDSISQYDQVKGRNMLAQFRNEYIKQVDVNGNGQSIYFALEDGNKLMGLNRVDCANMIMRFEGENILQDIVFIKNPEAKFIPPHELKATDMRLPDFLWRSSERPGRLFVEEHSIKKALLKEGNELNPAPAPKNNAPIALKKEGQRFFKDKLPLNSRTRLEQRVAEREALEDLYGQRLVSNGFEVFLKGRLLTFYLENPNETRVNGFFYVDVIPVKQQDLSKEDQRQGYQSLTQEPNDIQLQATPFLMQFVLPDYPFYTLRFGQYTIEEDGKRIDRWSEAWNK